VFKKQESFAPPLTTFSAAARKSPSQKLTLFKLIPKALFLLQSHSAPESVSGLKLTGVAALGQMHLE